MTETLAAAVFAAIGVIGGAIITVFGGRGRLHRLEAVSRVLKDMSPDDPAFGSLSEVRKADADELRKAQQSPVAFLVVLPVIATLLSVVMLGYGGAILAWSPPAYLVLAGALALACLTVIAFYAGVGIAGTLRLWKWAVARRKEANAKRERSRTQDLASPGTSPTP